MSPKDPFLEREANKYEKPVASREHLLELIKLSAVPMTYSAIVKKLGYGKDEDRKIGVKRRLRAMENAGQLTFNKFKQYVIADQSAKLTGRVIGHRDGYGFFAPDTGGKDFFISSHEMQRAIHGDIVEAILLDRTDRQGRKEIKILDVIEPRKAGIVGRFFVENHLAFVVPDDARINQDILIVPDGKLGARHGQVVVVEVVQRPSKRSNAVGKVIEVLGDHMAPGMEIDIALREHDLPHQWSQAVTDEIAELSEEVEESAKQGRVDIRDLPLVTIDGEDARDFDDAVYCERKKSGGWRLWVAIADVSYYVRPGSGLDDEAIARGNSVYFPSQVIPMLPEKLSNGLCSLNPDVDRLCMVCEMTISERGKLSGSKFYPAVMRSHARFTYTKVAAILDGDEALREQYAPRVSELEELHKLYTALNDARLNRGAIAFETEESRFIFNADKKIEAILPLVRNDAHKMIEECMILANVATAKFVEKHAMPGLFRVHDKPSEEKYKNFVSYLAELGIAMPISQEVEPRDYSDVLAKVAGRPDQELIQTMLLRSMKQAVYQSDNIGHFGLALQSYSHFTSPIRRYPDLVIHRVIKAILEAQENNPVNVGCFSYSQEQVVNLGEHCSMTERRADDATRDVADWLKCEYMQDHVGDEFTGVISTVTNFGMFVRLSDLHIEGLVHITSLGRDYYHFDDVRMSLTGEKTNTRYHVGDVLKVQVAAVNLDEKKIDLVLCGEDAVIKRAKPLRGANKGSANKSGGATKDKGKAKSTGRGGVSYQPERKGDKAAGKKPKKAKAKSELPKKEKSKAEKRKARKSRPGKNARKRAKQ
ncbi:ribonuclease R [Thalassotalea euphylliae]|uniref:Ribonuclease R n=1 Tax=Thalassotalea euphylliae TaxID=1655234 RepID=A0A3E0U480_9GAMM|nr:ribonuclease R [Thalassotalea euphylliae]REL31801.1 ribonuclease R [Thalassotalea euphylliae]